MPWNVGKNSLTGECCGCDTAPCGDCKKDDPKEPCDCNKAGYYNSPGYCESKLADPECEKCKSFGPCDQLVGGTVGTQGCYGPDSEYKNCEEIGCREASVGPPDPKSCEKEVECGSCQVYGVFCFKDAPKECSDFSFYDEDQAYINCVNDGGTKNDVLTCSKVATTGCSGLLCYDCKTCSDFGYQDSCPAGQQKVEVLDDSSLNKCNLTCYNCVPAGCNCDDFEGLDNGPTSTACGTPQIIYPWTNPSDPCHNKPCYFSRCKNCGDFGDSTSKPDPRPPCKNRETIVHPCPTGGCPNLLCWTLKDLKCSDFIALDGDAAGSKCAENSSECQADEFFEEGGCPGPFQDTEYGVDCPGVGPCGGLCRPYCGWKVTGFSTSVQGSPCCDSSFLGSVTNGNCTAGSAASVAAANISGAFLTTCTCTGTGTPCEKACLPPPEGCGPSGTPTSTTWPPGPGFGGGSFTSPTTTVTFGYEDCSISPQDLIITVTLERCEEC